MNSFDCYEVVAKDQSEALITFVQVLGRPNVHSDGSGYRDLMRRKNIVLRQRGKYTAEYPRMRTECSRVWGDFQSALIHLSEVPDEQ